MHYNCIVAFLHCIVALSQTTMQQCIAKPSPEGHIDPVLTMPSVRGHNKVHVWFWAWGFLNAFLQLLDISTPRLLNPRLLGLVRKTARSQEVNSLALTPGLLAFLAFCARSQEVMGQEVEKSRGPWPLDLAQAATEPHIDPI